MDAVLQPLDEPTASPLPSCCTDQLDIWVGRVLAQITQAAMASPVQNIYIHSKETKTWTKKSAFLPNSA